MTTAPSSRTLTLLGLAQGAALFVLYRGHHDRLWPADAGIAFNIALLLALLLPLVVYWAQGATSRAGVARLAGFTGALVAGIAAWQAASVFPVAAATRPPLVGFPVFAGLFLVCFMLVPLATARTAPDNQAQATLGYWDYPRLFALAWKNAVTSAQAGLLTGLVWAVLHLGAQLFHLIGIDWPRETLRRDWFWIPVSTTTFAWAYRAGLGRPHFAGVVQQQWFAVTAWLLPLTALIGTAFVLTALGGLDRLFGQGLSAVFLLWFAAFWLTFYNSAFQDGTAPPPLPGWLARVLPGFAVALAGVVALAGWALALRIGQHGLTADRVWGVLAVAVATVYAAGYLVPRRGGWMKQIAPTNVAASLVMAFGIVLLLSPVLDARRLAVDDQMARLAHGTVKSDAFDVGTLAQLGRPGHDALRQLIAARDAGADAAALAKLARNVLADNRRLAHGHDETGTTLAARLGSVLDVYPRGHALPPGLLAALQAEVAGWPEWKARAGCQGQFGDIELACPLLLVDLDADGLDEAVFWGSASVAVPLLFAREQGTWRRVGELHTPLGLPFGTIGKALASGDYKVEQPLWGGLRLGGNEYRVYPPTEQASPTH